MKGKILLWMTDIKDEYVLDADEYKPQETERRLLEQQTENKGQGQKTKAKENRALKQKTCDQRKGGHFMMYVGMGMGTAAVIAAICIGGTLWRTGPDQPVKPPVTLEQPLVTSEQPSVPPEQPSAPSEQPSVISEQPSVPSEQAETSEQPPATPEQPPEGETAEEDMTADDAAEQTTDKDMTEEAESNEAETAEEVPIPLPIEEGEHLLIDVGDDTLIALDRSWNVTSRIERVQLSPQNGLPYGETAWVIPANQPIPLTVLEEGSDAAGKTGLYSLEEDGWLLEPEYDRLNQVSGSLWTDSEPVVAAGNLMKADGTAVNDSEGVFRRDGDYIYDLSNLCIYDTEGSLCSRYEGTLIDIWGTNVICQNNEGQTVLQDVYGNPVWTETSGLTYMGRCGEYLNWKDGNGAGIVTDVQRNRMTDDVQFYQKNQDWNLKGQGLQLMAESPDGNRKLVQMSGENNTLYYYLCDENYQVMEMYREILLEFEEPVYLEANEGKRQYSSDWSLQGEAYGSWDNYCWDDQHPVITRVWTWYMDEQGALAVKDAWNDEILTVESVNVMPTEVSVDQAGEVTVIQWKGDGEEWNAACLADGVLQELPFSAAARVNLRMLPSGVLEVSGAQEDSEMYFLEDGTRLNADETKEVWYVSPKFQCMTDGTGLFVGGYERQQYWFWYLLAYPDAQ